SCFFLSRSAALLHLHSFPHDALPICALRVSGAGQKAVLMGWVNRRRDLGSLIFIDLRDRTGVTQVVFDREGNPALHDKAEALRRSEEHTSELQSRGHLVCRLLLEKKK